MPDTTRHILTFLLITLAGCVQPKHMGLYDAPEDSAHDHIRDFYSSSIYDEQLTSELWYTPSPSCIQVTNQQVLAYTGASSLRIAWDKPGGGCSWIGMGIGWDNWSGKNFESILDTAALSFRVRMEHGQSRGLPWAVGFEDFAGAQAWTGTTSDRIEGGVVTETWTRVILPLSAFPFDARDVDITSIKQVIFQFESSGRVYVDDIAIIPVASSGRKTLTMVTGPQPMADGLFSAGEWGGTPALLPDGVIHVRSDAEYLYLAAEVIDSSPLVNDRSASELWNGDAIEIAISTKSGSSPRRLIFYPGDVHLGLRLGKDPVCYHWTRNTILTNAIIATRATSAGYIVEAAIPWKDMGESPWQSGSLYDLELALDMSGDDGRRVIQHRWNSTGTEGFNTTPALWGGIQVHH